MKAFASKAKSAVVWNTLFNLFRDVLHFCTMLILVRLLSPDAYGQFGLVTSMIGFLSIFSFTNFISHLVQVRDEKDAHFQDHFTAGAVLNLGMFVITNLAALGMRYIPNWSEVAPYLHVMSLTFVLEWPCNLRIKMIEREFDWKTLRILHSFGLVLTAVLAVGMAWTGCGTYALLVPGMAVTLPFIVDLFFRLRWRPTWSWSWERYKPSFDFAVARIGSGLVLNGRQLLESTILAAILGFTGLGILNRSVGLAQLFCLKIATQLVYAIYPILTRIEDKEGNAARVGSLVLQTVIWTTLPLAVSFAVLASPVVRLIYGEKWLDVIPLVPWAMGWGVASALFHAAYMLLLARQKQKLCFTADILVLIGSALSLWLALPHGMKFYLMGTAVSQIIASVFLLAHLYRAKALTLAGWAKPLVAGAASATIAAGLCSILFSSIGAVPQISVMIAVAWGAVFIILYGLILRIAFRPQLENWLHYFPGQKHIARVLFIKACS